MRRPQGLGCSILGNYSPREKGGLLLGKQTGRSYFSDPLYLDSTIHLYTIKNMYWVTAAYKALFPILRKKAKDDHININNKTHHIYGTCYGAITVPSDVLYICQLI